jgi:hypothetical protein
MRCLYAITAAFVACSTNNNTSHDASIIVSSQSDASISSNDASAITDASSNEFDVASQYVACKTSSYVQTSYPRLTAKYCIDSLGHTFLEYYIDSFLNIECIWAKSTDNITRCLPNDYQTTPMYSDDSCSTLIVAAINASSSPTYFAVGTSNDASAWGNVYNVSDAYSPPVNDPIYLMEKNPGEQFVCEPLEFILANTTFYFLGSVVDLTIFQAK